MKNLLYLLLGIACITSSCNQAFLVAGVARDRGNIGQTGTPEKDKGTGIYLEVGQRWAEHQSVSVTIGIIGYSDDFDGNLSFPISLDYAYVFPLVDKKTKFSFIGGFGMGILGGHVGDKSLMVPLRYGFEWDILARGGFRIGLYNRHHLVLRRGTNYSANLMVGFHF